MTVDQQLDQFERRIVPLGKLIHALANLIDPPKPVYDADGYLSFRFTDPGLLNFCLLRGMRIVSGLNASIVLARFGLVQEMVVILRTVIEYSTHIDFMIASVTKDGNLSNEASDFVKSYFDDKFRSHSQTGTRKKLRQKDVHDAIGARLDRLLSEQGYGEMSEKPADRLLSDIYLRFSNYVHGRYPESMDMFGGKPLRIHLNGMRGTPKDSESIQIIDSQITSASLCFAGLVQGFKLQSVVNSDPLLLEWYSIQVGS